MRAFFASQFLGVVPNSAITVIIAVCAGLFLFPTPMLAQATHFLNEGSVTKTYGMGPNMLSAISLPAGDAGDKKERLLSTGRWIGAISGGTMGFLQITWSATGVSGIHGSFGENLLTGIPSMLVGAYVGSRSTEWATRKIMQGNPKPGEAALKGLFYGAIDGAITFTASMVPLIIIGYYTETIHFNRIEEPVLPWLLVTAVGGGVLYGGMFGVLAGAAYGPCLSLYMKF